MTKNKTDQMKIVKWAIVSTTIIVVAFLILVAVAMLQGYRIELNW